MQSKLQAEPFARKPASDLEEIRAGFIDYAARSICGKEEHYLIVFVRTDRRD